MVRKFYRRNKNQIRFNIPIKIMRSLGWKRGEKLICEIDGKMLIFKRQNNLVLSHIADKHNGSFAVDVTIDPPRENRSMVSINQVNDTLVVRFL